MRPLASARLLVSLTITASLAAPAASLAQGPGPRGSTAALRVWTYAAGTVHVREREAAQRLARRLLEDAGVLIDWLDCHDGRRCPRGETEKPEVVLILTGAPRATCGAAAPGGNGLSATVLISRPCIQEVALRIRQRPSARANPRLFNLEPAQLLGAAMAHEIGHVLGLKHSVTGLMRERFDLDDVLALAEGRLAFSPAQSHRMRASPMWTKARSAPGTGVGSLFPPGPEGVGSLFLATPRNSSGKKDSRPLPQRIRLAGEATKGPAIGD